MAMFEVSPQTSSQPFWTTSYFRRLIPSLFSRTSKFEYRKLIPIKRTSVLHLHSLYMNGESAVNGFRKSCLNL
jgi:hypothetical protein